jgi:hypothetical protein
VGRGNDGNASRGKSSVFMREMARSVAEMEENMMKEMKMKKVLQRRRGE